MSSDNQRKWGLLVGRLVRNDQPPKPDHPRPIGPGFDDWDDDE